MKKALSILLSICMMVPVLSIALSVQAQDSVTVQYSVCDGGMFTLSPSDIEVSADMSDLIGFDDKSTKPTVADATVAAHIYMFGEDFMDYAPLTITSSGWITASFGEESSATSYRINGKMDDGNGNYYNIYSTVKANDYIEYMFYQDASFYSDVYTAFDTRSVNLAPNEKHTFTLYAEEYDSNWNPVLEPAEDITITLNGYDYATTDENGQFTLSITNQGVYYLSAYGETDYGMIFAPYCKVTIDNHLYDSILSRMTGGADFLMKNYNSFNIDNSADFVTMLEANEDMDAYTDDFLASVKASLDNNDGKLIGASGKEDLGIYGSVILALNILGKDATDFEGYNIQSAFEQVAPNQISNPYYYRNAIRAADNEKFAKAMCDQFIEDYYVIGSGMTYYNEFSCDSTAVLLASIAPYKDDYSEVCDDAIRVIKSYTTDKGCYYSRQYTSENADSTAMALLAYSAIGDCGRAKDMYTKLVNNYESKDIGVMLAWGGQDAYATKDALMAFNEMSKCIDDAGYDEHCTYSYTAKAGYGKTGATYDRCFICEKNIKKTSTIAAIKSVAIPSTHYVYSGKAITPEVTVKDANGKVIAKSNYTVKYTANKSVGTAKVTVAFKGNYTGTVTRTFKIVPKSTSITSVKPSKKSFTVKWKKQATQTTGYQIQIATDKSFKKNVKTYTVKGNGTTSKKITGLKAKTKYYVRVRAYKSSSTYASGWSTYKTVTTRK